MISDCWVVGLALTVISKLEPGSSDPPEAIIASADLHPGQSVRPFPKPVTQQFDEAPSVAAAGAQV